jgi:hypothetical protein
MDHVVIGLGNFLRNFSEIPLFQQMMFLFMGILKLSKMILRVPLACP